MQEFYYNRVEDGTFCLTGYVGDEAEVVIPDDKVFTILSDKIFRGHSEITSIRIPDTVTDMGEFLFDGCENLRRLKLIYLCQVRHRGDRAARRPQDHPALCLQGLQEPAQSRLRRRP